MNRNTLFRRLLAPLATGIVLATTPQGVPVSAQGSTAGPLRHVDATRLDDLRTWDRYLVDGERSGALRLRTSREDPDLPSRRVERLDQFHNGLRIWGADVVRNSERGVPASIFGVIAPELTISTQPTLTVAEAAAAMLRAGGSDSTVLRDPELLVLPLDSGEYRLAYKALVGIPADNDVVHLFTDANTGLELLRYTAIQRQSAVGAGRGVLGDQKKLSVFRQGSLFTTEDSHRPPILLTFDMRYDLSRFKNIQQRGAPVFPSDVATDGDNVWTDPAVVDAHAHVGMAYDYFYKRFGRNGLDNRNKPIYVYTNAVSQQGALSLSAADLRYAINASWCGSCGPMQSGTLFLGNGSVATFAGKSFTYFAGALDIVAHELTHGVIDSSSDLIYRNESGALNEAFADIMGKSVEFFFHPPGSSVGQADYTLGKDISRAVAPGVLNGDRSLANPVLFNDPDYYGQRSVGSSDGGYVHTNSGIANHAFYLAIEGGTHRLSRMTVQGVGSANRDQIERVFYRAFTLLMPSDSTFVTARAATTQAARDLYGAGSAVERAVDQAWSAVGVPTPNSISSFTGTVQALDRNLYTTSVSRNGNYSINLRAKTADLDIYLVFNTPACTRWPGLGRDGLPLFPSSCVIARSIFEFGVESVRAPVRAGDGLALWVVNYESSPVSFTAEYFIE